MVKQENPIYKYEDNIITKLFTIENKYHDGVIGAITKSGEHIYKSKVNNFIERLLENFYLIKPNPLDDMMLLVYDPLNSDEKYFYVYNQSREVQKSLREQYNAIDEILYGFSKKMTKIEDDNDDIPFTHICSYNQFKAKLNSKTNVFIEDVKTSDNIYIENMKKVYDFETMEFKEDISLLPSKTNNIIKDETIDNKDLETLDKYFNTMYDNIEDLEQFLYYILCNFNKKYVQQSVFLVIDKSGMGKTSKIKAFVELGLNNIATSGLLKNTELYNLVNCNSIIFNETQDSKTINGSTLNILCDNSPMTVTRKSKTSITLKTDEKPLIQIMGESLPPIKAFSDGTTRRLLLVPQVSKEFENMVKEDVEKVKNEFYSILNEKPVTTLTYYRNKIKEHNIIEKTHLLKSKMEITLDDLSKLTEHKENIIEEYINLNPYAKHDETNETLYLIEINSLELFLKYIDEHIITVNHFNDPKLFKKYVIRLLKENNGFSNIKDYGVINRKNKNYYYMYQLTKKGKDLFDKIMYSNEFKNKIFYTEVTPFEM